MTHNDQDADPAHQNAELEEVLVAATKRQGSKPMTENKDGPVAESDSGKNVHCYSIPTQQQSICSTDKP